MIRFANGLKLGNHTHAVANTALRLLAHMKRDWIHTGRRPSGICGACLFLAARMHNFQPTITEIARIVRIGEATLQKRFAEVSNTRTAALTAEEIESLEVGNDHASMIADGAAADPPAFQRLQIAEEKKRRLRALLQSKPDLGVLLGLPAGTDESALVDADMEGVVKQMRRAMTASPVLAKVYEALESADGPTNLGAGAVLGAEDEDEDEEAEEADVEAEEEEGDQKKRVKGRRSAAPKRASRALDELAKLQLSFPGAAGADMGLLESLQAEVADVAAAPPLASQLRKLGGALSPEEHAALLASENNPLVRAATLAGPAAERLDALAEEKERMIARLEAEMEAYTAELAHEGFSDLDDAELDEWVLTAEQRDQKTRLWEALHHEYLVDQENKRILEAAGVTAKRKPRENRRRVTGSTAEQRVSTKINVDALALLEGLTGEETYRGPAAQLKNEVPLKKMEEEEAVAAKPLGAEPVVKKQERPEAEPARAPVVSELAATSIDALLEEESRAAALPARSTSHAAALSLLAPKRPNPRPPPLAKRPRK
jgi:transcription factor IIIB subunit 2